MALPHALAIIERGVLPALRRAKRYAGEKGRIATMPELVSARVHSVPGAWDTWFTTSTSLYFGRSMLGNPIIIIAHGTGLLMYEEDCKQAYEYTAVCRNNQKYGTIGRDEFYKLEAGRCGDVIVIDAKPYMSTRSELMGCLESQFTINKSSYSDMLMKAIFGPDWQTYILNFQRQAADAGIGVSDPNRLGELRLQWEFTHDVCWANFLSFELTNAGASLSAKDDSVRFVAIRDGEPIRKIVEKPQLKKLVERVKETQSAFDKLRSDVEILHAMDAEEVL